jgi:membrane-associated phospholipid phosphatase
MPAERPPAAAEADMQKRRWRRVRLAAAGVYVVAFAGVTLAWGFPASRDRLLVWVILGLVVATLGRPDALSRLIVDFLPVVVFLYAYDLLRGSADQFSSHVYVLPQLRVDEWLFGGTAPTVTLQRALWTPGSPRVWDYVAALVYVTYFLVPITVAAVLWLRRRTWFRRYVTLWVGLSFTALATYVLYPAAPPWMASHRGVMQHVVRIAPKLTRTLGVDLTRVMGSERYVNEVAAVPSLHAGTALLISMFFWNRAPRWRWLLALYPLAMGVSLVYLGEHYVSDVLLGFVYAIVVYFGGGRLYDLWMERRAAQGRLAPATPTSPESA